MRVKKPSPFYWQYTGKKPSRKRSTAQAELVQAQLKVEDDLKAWEEMNARRKARQMKKEEE